MPSQRSSISTGYAYCPFDIDPVATGLNLKTAAVNTRYGRVVLQVSRVRQSEVATIYLHGIVADWTTWVPILKAEAALQLAVHDQILIDMPGFGASENKLGSLDIADIGNLYLEIASLFGYQRVRLVGHSMGGFLALDMASRHIGRVESLHLVAGPYFSILACIQHPLRGFFHSPSTGLAFGGQYVLARMGRFGASVVHGLNQLKLLRLLTFPAVRHPLLLRRSVVDALSELYYPEGFILTAANGHGYNADRQWAKVACPIWATFGTADWLVPQKDMRRFQQCQPATKCTVVGRAGHLHHIEWPFETLTALQLWAQPSVPES